MPISKLDPRILELDCFLGLDYSQMEIRILAEISGDKNLIRMIRSGRDLHCQVGHMLTGWPEDKIANDEVVRKSVKNFHFGLIFGLGEEGMRLYLLARGVDLKPEIIHQYYVKYFGTFEGVKLYIDGQRKFEEQHHYVDNFFGARRYTGNTGDPTRTTNAGNQAVNTPIQSAAHTFVLIAMALLNLKKQTYNLLQCPVMEVHDSLFFRVKVKDLPKAHTQGIHLLQEGCVSYTEKYFKHKMRVPLVAEAKCGFTLGTMVKYFGSEDLPAFIAQWKKKFQEEDAKSWKQLMPEEAA